MSNGEFTNASNYTFNCEFTIASKLGKTQLSRVELVSVLKIYNSKKASNDCCPLQEIVQMIF